MVFNSAETIFFTRTLVGQGDIYMTLISECHYKPAIGFVFAICMFLCLSGCMTTSHQVLRYQSPLNYANNYIPGIEPEEAPVKIMIHVVGKGVEPSEGTPIQKKLMAERAAVIDGYRQLAERIAGIIIETESRVGNNSLSMDKVMIQANAYLRGAQVSTINYQAGFATADVKLYFQPRESKFYNGPTRTGLIKN